MWTDYADTIIKFSPIDRFPISIAVEATLNLVKTIGYSIKPWLDSGLWTLDSGLQIFSQDFPMKKKEKIQLFLKKENKMKMKNFKIFKK